MQDSFCQELVWQSERDLQLLNVVVKTFSILHWDRVLEGEAARKNRRCYV